MRFFLPRDNFQDSTIVVDDRDILHQITRVLRLRAGDAFVALDNTGREYEVEIKSVGKNLLNGAIINVKENQNEPACEVNLYQALPKKMDLFEMVLQKCTEIGVSHFVPIVTARGERDHVNNMERLLRIIREAAEQSERGTLPTLVAPMLFRDAIKNDKNPLKLMAHARLEDTHMEYDFKACKNLSIYVGPEGGFTNEEIEFALKQGANPISLGPRILRTETAAIALASKILLS